VNVFFNIIRVVFVFFIFSFIFSFPGNPTVFQASPSALNFAELIGIFY